MRHLIALLIAAATLTTGCGSDATDSTATSVAQTTTIAVPSGFEVARTEDLVYLEADGHEFLLDVYVPTGDGPWPVVVAFHGTAPSLKDDSYVTVVAQAAAETGMVVFVPSWVTAFSSSASAEDPSSGFAASACALAFAHQYAPDYGGDPGRIVTYGFSAGAAGAAWLALCHGTEPTPGCVADEQPTSPVGAVLGDSEYFLHTQLFQDGFDNDPAGMLAHVAALVDPATWPDDHAARFRIWSAANGTDSRPFDDAWDENGWLAQRDPDGTIREDLDTLGQL
ncbi:MAG: carboxylesterase family protein, partial [Acidimicrobiia bacterium]|nr:carboxylesterase family protein [Acidimicrobiia bacterium]